MHYDHVFVKFMVKEIEKLYQDQKAENIIMYVPKDLKEIVTEEFPKAYAKKLEIHMGDYIQISFPKLFDLLKMHPSSLRWANLKTSSFLNTELLEKRCNLFYQR